MNEIEISSDEKSSRILSQVNLERSLFAIKNAGYVIISNAVSHEHLDKIGHQMDKDAQKLIAAEQWSGAGGLPGHLMLGPPPFSPYVFSDIVANPFAYQISHKLILIGIANTLPT